MKTPRKKPAAKPSSVPWDLAPEMGTIWELTFGPDGKTLALSADDGGALFDVPARKELARYKRVTGGKANGHAVSPDGKLWASALKSITIWDAATGKRVRTLKGHKHDVNALCFSPDGARLASGSGANGTPGDFTVRLWDPHEDGKALLVLKGHEAPVLALRFVGADTLLSVDVNQNAFWWDLRKGTPEKKVALGADADSCAGNMMGFDDRVSISPDGSRIASRNANSAAFLWDSRTGKVLREVECDAFSVAVSADGATLCCITNEPAALTLWPAGRKAKALATVALRETSGAPCFSPDGEFLAWPDGDLVRLRPLPLEARVAQPEGLALARDEVLKIMRASKDGNRAGEKLARLTRGDAADVARLLWDAFRSGAEQLISRDVAYWHQLGVAPDAFGAEDVLRLLNAIATEWPEGKPQHRSPNFGNCWSPETGDGWPINCDQLLSSHANDEPFQRALVAQWKTLPSPWNDGLARQLARRGWRSPR